MDGEVPSGNGSCAAEAVWAGTMADEYEILRLLHLEVTQQAFVEGDDGTPYDVFETVDTETGKPRTIWFDISGYHDKTAFSDFIQRVIDTDPA